jgi:hypothetical protein
VSLIFEALKKLDREKKAPERGFLVLGGAPVAGERRLRVPVLLLLLAAAGGGGFLIARATRPAPAIGPPVAPPSTASAAVPRLLPPAPLPPEAAERPAVSEPPPAAPSPEPGSSGAPVAPAVGAEVPVPATPAPAAPAPAFALQAVADQDGQPVAIVNGQLVRVGDLVNGARVLRIEREEVELEQGGRRLVLTF